MPPKTPDKPDAPMSAPPAPPQESAEAALVLVLCTSERKPWAPVHENGTVTDRPLEKGEKVLVAEAVADLLIDRDLTREV